MRHAVSTTDSLAQINAAFGLPPDAPAPESPPQPDGPPGAYIEADQPRLGVAVEAEAVPEPAATEPVPTATADTTAAPPPADASDTDAPPPPTPPPYEKQAKGKRKHDLTARIDDLTAKLYTIKRENDALRQQLSEAQASPRPPAVGASPAEPLPARPSGVETESVPLPVPVESDFGTWEEYERALRDYTIREAARIARVEAARVVEQTARAQTEQARHEAILDQHRTRLLAFQQTHPDFLEVLEAIKDVPAPPALQEAIVLSERGPALMYYLAQHPDDLARLVALPPLRMAAELGKLEAGVDRQDRDDAKETAVPVFTAPVSHAPPPPSTPARGTAPPPKRSLAHLPPAEYRAKRREQLAARFPGRR